MSTAGIGEEPAVKSDVAFVSAIIGPDGRIVERAVTPQGARAVLVADVAVELVVPRQSGWETGLDGCAWRARPCSRASTS